MKAPIPITLRPVRPEDEAFLFQVYASTRAEELAVLPWNREQKEGFLRMQFLAQNRHYRKMYPEAQFGIILENDQPAGRLYVARRTTEIHVIDIALLPVHRGRGIGTQLLNELIEEAHAAHLPIRIHVERSNPAQPLYERLGFRQVEDQGMYLLMERRAGVA